MLQFLLEHGHFLNIDISQGSVATHFRIEYLDINLLQIYHRVCQWRNFENRLTVGEVMGKSLVSCFYWLTVYISRRQAGRRMPLLARTNRWTDNLKTQCRRGQLDWRDGFSKVKADKLTAHSIHVSSGNAEHYFVKCVVNCVLTSNTPAVDYFMQILLYRVVGLVTGCVPQAGYASSMLTAACLALLYAYY